MKNIFNILGAALIGSLFINTACSDDCEHLVLDGNDAFITSCSASIGFGSCNGIIEGDTIWINIPEDASMSTLKVEMELSENATVIPAPDTIREWSIPLHFTVTSASKINNKDYVIVVRKILDENVFVGSVRLGSQKEIDGFGENKYTKVGEVILFNGSKTDPITDLSPLSSIREINGGLTIMGLGVRTITLENLEKLGRFAMQSPAATRVRFPKLKFVGGDFKIGEDVSGAMPVPHSDLEEVTLPALEYVGGNLKLFLCGKLKTLESLSNLTYVGKNVDITGGLFTSLKGFENLKNINGDFAVQGPLESLDGFAVETVKGSLILAIEDVTSLEELKTLKKVGVMFELSRNRYLKNLKGLEHINVKVIQLKDFLAVESLEGISVQPEMEHILLKGFLLLKDITALSPLKKINSSIIFQHIPELENLKGLENLEYVENQCRFENMFKLTDMSALNNLTNVGEIYWTRMNVLKELPTLSKLTEVESIYLENLLAIENLEGLKTITKIIKGQLAVLACKELLDISGIGNITEINFYEQKHQIWIESNEKLASFCPIFHLLKKYLNVSGRITVQKNYYNPTKADVSADKCEGVGGSGITGGKG